MILPMNDPEPVTFRRQPLIGAPVKRRLSRATFLTIGVVVGLLLGILVR